jgi:hypothetical protein
MVYLFNIIIFTFILFAILLELQHMSVTYINIVLGLIIILTIVVYLKDYRGD